MVKNPLLVMPKMDVCKKYILIDQLILFLSQGQSYTQIAKTLKVDITTLYRIRKSREYKEQVNEFLERSSGRLALQYHRWLQRSFSTLDRIASGEMREGDAVRVSASKSLVDGVVKNLAILKKDIEQPVTIEVNYLPADEVE